MPFLFLEKRKKKKEKRKSTHGMGCVTRMPRMRSSCTDLCAHMASPKKVRKKMAVAFLRYYFIRS
jgi:hypothetical protein